MEGYKAGIVCALFVGALTFSNYARGASFVPKISDAESLASPVKSVNYEAPSEGNPPSTRAARLREMRANRSKVRQAPFQGKSVSTNATALGSQVGSTSAEPQSQKTEIALSTTENAPAFAEQVATEESSVSKNADQVSSKFFADPSIVKMRANDAKRQRRRGLSVSKGASNAEYALLNDAADAPKVEVAPIAKETTIEAAAVQVGEPAPTSEGFVEDALIVEIPDEATIVDEANGLEEEANAVELPSNEDALVLPQDDAVVVPQDVNLPAESDAEVAPLSVVSEENVESSANDVPQESVPEPIINAPQESAPSPPPSAPQETASQASASVPTESQASNVPSAIVGQNSLEDAANDIAKASVPASSNVIVPNTESLNVASPNAAQQGASKVYMPQDEQMFFGQGSRLAGNRSVVVSDKMKNPQWNSSFNDIGTFNSARVHSNLFERLGASQSAADNRYIFDQGLESNRFGESKYSCIVADFEWLGWQTSGSNRAYARFLSEDGALDDSELAPSGSGLRARAGFRLESGWDLVGGFTYFNADKERSAESSDWNLFNPQSRFQASTDKIDAKCETDLQIVDVELGKWQNFRVASFRPFIGARWTQLNEKMETSCDYFEFTDVADECNDFELDINRLTDRVSRTSRANAIGVRFGTELRKDLFRRFALYGRGAGTIASANIKTTSYETVEGTVVDLTKVKRSRAVPSIDTALGLEWKHGPVEIRGGYEFNMWYGATEFNGKRSNFCTHGCFAGIGWNQ